MSARVHTVRFGRYAGSVMTALLSLAVALALLMELGGRPAAVDWQAVRAVVLESDDWGLCGFFPGLLPVEDPLRGALPSGRFPEPYWQSTLEDSSDVARLAQLLGAGLGRDGRPAVLQANYIVSALHHEDAADGSAGWLRWDLPALPPPYRRPGLWSAVDAAIARGVWRPELHGAFHYDPELRRRAAAAGPALAAARRGILLFPGSERAWELGHWRSTDELSHELARSKAIFAGRFGRAPVSVCAPDYVWDSRCEDLWERHGLRVIQAKREQRSSRRPSGGFAARTAKVLERLRDKLRHPGRTYLDRNCRFEPAQHSDAAAAVTEAVAQVRRAWSRGQPAIIETHRVNYVSLDPASAAAGRAALAQLLAALTTLPEGAPLFLTDDEVAQLQRGGVSWSRRGRELVLRNLSHSSRWLAIPVGAVETLGGGPVMPPQPAVHVVLLPAGQLGTAWPIADSGFGD